MDSTKEYKVGIYTRLSNEDARHGESMSVENQKLLLKKYCLEHGWEIKKIYKEMKTLKLIQFENMNTPRKARNKGF